MVFRSCWGLLALTPDCQELREGMNLKQMRYMRPLKAYVCDLNTQMNDTSKMG